MDFRRVTLATLMSTALTGAAFAEPIKTVFVIDMENHNFTDPNPNGTTTTVNGVNTINTPIGAPGSTQRAPAQLLGNVAAPFLNSLITPGNPNAAQTAYATNYTHVLPGQNQSVHPSEPNYLWQEGGSNFPNQVPAGTSPGGNLATGGNGVRSDAAVSVVAPLIGGNKTLSGVLQDKGISWRSYQEDTQMATTGGLNGTAGNGKVNGQINGNNNNLTGTIVDQNKYTVPLVSLSGTSANYTNSYNGSHQYDFATKHDGQLFFDATNGTTKGAVTTNAQGTGSQDTANKEISHYRPLTKDSFQHDLDTNDVARYNLITPNQFNDMHTGLAAGFDYNGTHFTGDQAAVAQGDSFLKQIIAQIMGSQAYKDNGAIVIWYDESEPTAVLDANGNIVASKPDDVGTTIPEIVISPLAKGNAFASDAPMNHDSDLLFLERLFGIDPNEIPRDPRDTGPINDLEALFADRAVPEPASALLLLPGLIGLAGLRRRR